MVDHVNDLLIEFDYNHDVLSERITYLQKLNHTKKLSTLFQSRRKKKYKKNIINLYKHDIEYYLQKIKELYTELVNILKTTSNENIKIAIQETLEKY